MSKSTIRKKLIALGIVGTGPLMDPVFQAAFRCIAPRVAIRGVYDVVPARAEQAAKDWKTVAAPSLTSFMEWAELTGVIILDTDWQHLVPLEIACRLGKSNLLLCGDQVRLATQAALATVVREAGLTVMVAFPRRHTPATNRLRELMATRLGKPLSIIIEAVVSAPMVLDRNQLMGLIDWCHSLVGRPSHLMNVKLTEEQCEIQFLFPETTLSKELTADILLRAPATPGSGSSTFEVCQVQCEQGSAKLSGSHEITWESPTETRQEDLAAERSSLEIILDQYCRRLVGGLVPVSDLTDAVCAARLVEDVFATKQSLASSE